MRPPLLAAVIALLLGVLASFAAACGQDQKGLLGPVNAARLKSDLDQLDNAVAAGRCERVAAEITSLRRRIDALPASTDRRLRQRLSDGVDTLAQQAPDECSGQQTTDTTTTETQPTTETQTQTQTTETQTQPTETQTQPATQPQTQPTATQPPTTTGGTPPGQTPTTPGQSGGAQAPLTGQG